MFLDIIKLNINTNQFISNIFNVLPIFGFFDSEYFYQNLYNLYKLRLNLLLNINKDILKQIKLMKINNLIEQIKEINISVDQAINEMHEWKSNINPYKSINVLNNIADKYKWRTSHYIDLINKNIEFFFNLNKEATEYLFKIEIIQNKLNIDLNYDEMNSVLKDIKKISLKYIKNISLKDFSLNNDFYENEISDLNLQNRYFTSSQYIKNINEINKCFLHNIKHYLTDIKIITENFISEYEQNNIKEILNNAIKNTEKINSHLNSIQTELGINNNILSQKI